MSVNPNNSRPEGAKRLGFQWEFMDQILYVCYTPSYMNIMRAMLNVTNWNLRIYQMGRKHLSQQTHLSEATVSTCIQDFVQDGLLSETISRTEVQFMKHRQNYRFNIPSEVILDCRNWFPHAKSEHHSDYWAEKFCYKPDSNLPPKEIIRLGVLPEVTDPWEDFQSPDSPF